MDENLTGFLVCLWCSILFRRKEENESKALLVSDKGKIYRVDLESGEIKWFHDTKEPIYKKYRACGVVEYVDIGLEDDEYPYYYSVSRRPKVYFLFLGIAYWKWNVSFENS